jgi:HEAT repeat protein
MTLLIVKLRLLTCFLSKFARVSPVILFVLLISWCPRAAQAGIFLGPYSGKVIDAQTREPIEGASVLFYWTHVVPAIPHSYSDFIKARLVYTDGKGEYSVPLEPSLSGLLLESTRVTVYQPGYEAYQTYDWHGGRDKPGVRRWGNVIALKKIPPFFDHDKHVREMRDFLWTDDIYETRDLEESNAFLVRVLWEKRRSRWYEARRNEDGELRKYVLKDYRPPADTVPKLAALLRHRNPRTRAEAALELGVMNDATAIPLLLEALKDEDPWVRVSALSSLGNVGTTKELGALLSVLEHADDWRGKFVQQEAVISVGKILQWQKLVNSNMYVPQDRDVKKALFVLKFHLFDDYLRPEILKVLGNFVLREYLSLGIEERILIDLEDPDAKIRKMAYDTIRKYVFSPADHKMRYYRYQHVDRYKELLRSPYREAQLIATDILTASGKEKAIYLLAGTSTEGDIALRKRAIGGLGNFDDERALEALAVHLADERTEVRETARDSFLSAAERTKKGFLLASCRNGRRFTAPYNGQPSTGGQPSVLRIHPRAVDILMGIVTKTKGGAPLELLDTVTRFYIGDQERVLQVLHGLKRFLSDPDEHVRVAAVKTLGRLHVQESVDLLFAALDDQSPEVRKTAVEELFRNEDERLRALALELLEEPASRLTALAYLKTHPEGRALRKLLVLIYDTDPEHAGAAVQALGTIGDPGAVEPLIEVIESESPDGVKKDAITALGMLGDARAVPVLIRCLSVSDRNPQYDRVAVEALGAIGDPGAVGPLIEVIESDSPDGVKKDAITALGMLGDARAVPVLMRRLSPSGEDWSALHALAEIDSPIDSPGAFELLVELLHTSRSVKQKGDVLKVLGNVDDERVDDILIDTFLSEARTARGPIWEVVIVTLGKRKNRQVIEPLLRISGTSNNWNIHKPIIMAFRAYEGLDMTEELTPFLKHKDKSVRIGAIYVLGKLGDPEALPLLHAQLESPDPDISFRAKHAIKDIHAAQVPEDERNKDGRRRTSTTGMVAQIPVYKRCEPHAKGIDRDAIAAAAALISSAIAHDQKEPKNTKSRQEHIRTKANIIELYCRKGEDVFREALAELAGGSPGDMETYFQLMESNITLVGYITKNILRSRKGRQYVASQLTQFIGKHETAMPFISVELLKEMGDSSSVNVLQDVFRQKEAFYKPSLLDAIAAIDGRQTHAFLVQTASMAEETTETRVAAIRAIGDIGSREAMPLLIRIVASPRESLDIRVAAALALGKMKEEQAIETLMKISQDGREHPWLLSAAKRSLERTSHEEEGRQGKKNDEN